MNTNDPQFFDEISGQLKDSAFEVFATLFDLNLQPATTVAIVAEAEPQVAAMVGLEGALSMVMCVHLQLPFARQLARQFLRLDDAADLEEAMVSDVAGELSNMILGSVKSRLSDQGMPCSLTFPSVLRGNNLTAMTGSAGDASRHLALVCESGSVRIDVFLKRSA